MPGGFFGNFVGNTKSGFNKLTNLEVGDMDWKEWGALAVTTAAAIAALSFIFAVAKSIWEEYKWFFIIGAVIMAGVWMYNKFSEQGTREADAAPIAAGAKGAIKMKQLSFYDESADVGAPRKIDIAISDANVKLGNVEYADLLPQQSVQDGLPEEIALLQAKARAEQHVGLSA